MQISTHIFYIGVNDHSTDLFEGQYPVPNGMAYNSYVILDEKIAVLDTVDQHFGAQWLANLKAVLNGKTPDYLVVHHMEPDHSANIAAFLAEYPETTVVASAKAFTMMQNFFGTDYAAQRIVAGEGFVLELGEHALQFITAPMVHWPEVLVSYERTEKILFSADAFGKFGALDVEEDWTDEARRYYIGIVGKYGMQVQALLKKAAALEIQTICPLHGPALTENLSPYLGLYQTWSSYTPETDGVLVAYASVYGHTEAAAKLLADSLRQKGIAVTVCDLARTDVSYAVQNAFRYSKLALASITYNGDMFPHMKTFLSHLLERNYQSRTVAFLENGSWASTAAKVMRKTLETAKNLTFTETTVTIKSAVSDASRAQIEALAAELAGEAPRS